ncbi:NlpC/P60 family protein [Arthrobacter zhaoguopingii]|uniref:NlpC/P60 family protein n=1 Tax=Arthrobacter zhaoguopingii TaxID=2681491 RepID=UPI001FEA0D3A|nr:NlpC/P60 family protein [Arthrobacter zhaoguopingii]
MNPLTALSKAVTSNAGSVGRQAAAVVAASGLVLAAGLPAHGSSTAEREVQSSSSLSVTAPETAAVSAAATAAVSFEREAVTVAPAPVVVEAPVVEAPVVEVPAAAPVVRPAVAAPAAPAPAPMQVAAVAAPAPAPAAPAPAPKPEVPSSGIGAALVGSAYSQIGVAQDCTAMVEKALRSVGKSVGDLAPGQFFQYGDVVGTPAAGDLVITGGHVAIYVGNGQVISGGLNGLNTGLHSLSDLPGASFVRVR